MEYKRVAADSRDVRAHRVSKRAVIDHWLARDGEADPSATDAEALDRLLDRRPGTADALWRDEPSDWYHCQIPVEHLSRLRVVPGPRGLGWHALTDSGTVGGAATTLAADESVAVSGVNRRHIERLANEIADGGCGPIADIICFARRPWETPAIIDGNHRATAVTLARRRRPDSSSMRRRIGAFVGVGRNTPIGDLRRAGRAVRWWVRTGGRRAAEPNGF
ncbi:hypothetical protein ACNS7O_09925 [Haloferacaceae archaeon DSL9]